MFKKRWVWLVILVVVGFLVRYLVYGFIKLPWIVYDEFTYLDTARQIVRGHFLSAFSRDQLYPSGWPIFLAAFVGFFHNPYVQYKAALLVTMFLSSLVPVFAYLLSGSFVVAFLTTFYPPLFVYSSNIFSETAFTLFLMIGFLALREMLKEDLRNKLYIYWSGIIFGFMLYYIRITRSFGIVHIPALIATLGIFYYYCKQHIQKAHLRKIVAFVMMSTVAYLFFEFGARLLLISPHGLYEQTPYLTAIHIVFFNPLLFLRMVHNQVVIFFVSSFWILPIFFVQQSLHDLRDRKWHMVFVRMFLALVLLFSFILTLAHMGKTVQNNDQYLVFSRYMDPIFVVWFVFAVIDMSKCMVTIKTLHIHKLWLVIIGYVLIYLRFGYYFGSYKFGNTMPVYFFSLVKANVFFYPLLVLFVVGMVWALMAKRKTIFVVLFATLFVWQSVVATMSTTDVPAYVQDNHVVVIKEWQQALASPGTNTPICLYPDALWRETYYMYHFLYPYQYLKDCTPARQDSPRWVIISATTDTVLPHSCVFTYSFASSGGDTLFYCPRGL